MRTIDLKDILATVELMRSQRHPDLSAEFLGAVVRAEEENSEDNEGALSAIEAALKMLPRDRESA